MAAREAGVRFIKLTVGVGDDAGRVAAVRAALGPAALLRLDANGAWSVDEAARAIGALTASWTRQHDTRCLAAIGR